MTGSLAANRQTFAHQTNQLTPVLTHPLLPDPAVHCVFSLFLSLFFSLSLPLSPSLSPVSVSLVLTVVLSLGTTSAATDARTIGPGAQARSKSSQYNARFSSSFSFSLFPFLSLPRFRVSLFFRDPPSTLPAILPYRYPFNPFSSGARSRSPRTSRVATYKRQVSPDSFGH